MAFFTLLFSESLLDEVNALSLLEEKVKSFEKMVYLWLKAVFSTLQKQGMKVETASMPIHQHVPQHLSPKKSQNNASEAH